MAMERRVLGLAAVAGVLGSLGARAAGTEDADQAAVAARVEQLREAMLHPDWQTLEGLMAPELTYGHSDRRVMNRAEIIDSLLSGRSHFDSITQSDQTIRIVGDLAIVRQRFVADAVSNGVASHPDLRILQVWQKRPDTWRLLVRQAH